MAEKTSFRTIGKLYENDGEYKAEIYGLGTFYSKKNDYGLVLVDDDDNWIAYLRMVNASKVSGFLDLFLTGIDYALFPDRDKTGQYNITQAKTVEVSEDRGRGNGGGGKSRKW